MPAAFDNLTALPATFNAGEVVTWVETLTDYPVASYAVAYKFSGVTPQDGFQQFSIAGTETSTATYTFATLATYKPGSYSWEKQVTQASPAAMRVVERGTVVITPNLAATPTTTFAAAQVALLQGALATLATSTNQSVSFNGQSFSRGNISDYRGQLVYWQAIVLAEQRAIDALTGKKFGRVAVQFVQT